MRRRWLIAVVMLCSLVVGALPAASGEFPPQAARGLTVPVGFAARPFANLPPGLLPTSLAWGDTTVGGESATRDSMLHGTKLYVTAVSGNAFSGSDNGFILSFEDEGIAPTIAATGLDQPLGVVMGPDDTLYVTETENNRGRVTALRDEDGDGTFEATRTVIKNLPNGRHQTNGLTFGPDGNLYVANGNATDDGIECGPAIVPGSGEDDCPAQEVLPWSGSILRVDPAWTDVDLLTDIRRDSDGVPAADGMDDESVLVARGFRNIYDVDFDPLRPDDIWTPMNGPDNPSGSEPLYGFSVTDQRLVAVDGEGNETYGPRIENAGFPSCLYDPHTNAFPVPQLLGGHEHPGTLEPQDNPNARVIDMFGPCRTAEVMYPKSIFAEGHEGTSGLTFTRGANFPERYRGDLFVAEWGSLWNLNGGTVTGHKIIHLDLDENREVLRQREFMSGVLPMDVTFGPNGHMYVADMSGQIYDVSHLGAGADALTERATVQMSQGQFVPQVLTVVQGQTVQWVNADTTPHTVRAAAGVKVVDPQGAESPLQAGTEMDSSGEIAPGGTHSHTFDGPTGTYHYTSTTQPNTMRGTIIVLPAER